MATLTDRIASVLSGLGGALTRIGGTLRSPTVAPDAAPIPGVPRAGYGGQANRNTEVARALGMPEAYLGRLSYDAGPSLARFSSHPATDLTPEKIVGAQQEAVAGYPFRWEEMIEQVLSHDGHLSGIAQQRVDDVLKGSWRLVRSTNDDLALCLRNFCDEVLRDVDTLSNAFGWLLMGNAYCYNAAEIVWRETRVSFPGPEGKRIGPIDAFIPARLDPVHPKHFRFDLRTDEPLFLFGSEPVSLPFGKFIFYRGEGYHPITERCGYMWPCVWYSMFRSIAWSSWATRVERFDMPIPLLAYDGELAQYTEYAQAMQDILNAMGSGKGIRYPKNNFTVDVKDPPRGGTANDPQSALSDACDAAQSVRVLGATLTAKIGNVGSFAATGKHTEVKYNREEADARRLWDANRSGLLAPLVAFNAVSIARALNERGMDCMPLELVRRVPRGLQRVPRDVDPVERMGLFKDAVNELGMDVDAEATYDEFNLPQPVSKTAGRLPGKPQPVTSGGKVVGSVEAATEGAEAPKEPQPPPRTSGAKQEPTKPATPDGE